MQVTYEKGQSGNPDGKAKGTLNKRSKFFYDYIEPKRTELLDLAMEKAHQGDSKIIQFLIERFVPKQPLHVIEYHKLELECEKLRKENAILDEAPELLEILKEDPIIKEKLRERLKRRTFKHGKTNEISLGETKDTAAKESGISGY